MLEEREGIFKCIFVNENQYIVCIMLLKFVPTVHVDNRPR